MPYVAINKDLTEAKTTVVMGLTKRQLLFGPIGIVFGIILFFLTKNIVGSYVAGVLLFLTVVPFFFVAEYKKNGQYAEVLVKNWYDTKFVRNTKRPYVTENLYGYHESV